MIVVNCTHCGKERILKLREIDEMIRNKKSITIYCRCGKTYEVELGSELVL